jgi:hypothetical protein
MVLIHIYGSGLCTLYTEWSANFYQVLPGKMLDFLDAPVPYIVSFMYFFKASLFPVLVGCYIMFYV